MAIYTIKRMRRVEDLTDEIRSFVKSEAINIAALFDNGVDGTNFDLEAYLEKDIFHFYFCWRNEELSGCMFAYLTNSPFDFSVKYFCQLLMYSKLKSGRTAHYLFDKFVDIGTREADYIITMTSKYTNIKESTLVNRGFNHLETQFIKKV